MIYSDRNYNRYTYRRLKRVDREEILVADGGEVFLQEMEMLLFRGKGAEYYTLAGEKIVAEICGVYFGACWLIKI